MTNFKNSVAVAPLANHELERQVLGSLLNDPDAIYKIGDELTPDFFNDPFHRGLFGRILAGELAGEQMDAFTLSQGMTTEEKNQFKDIAGRHSDGSNSVKHAAELRSLWQKRELQALGNESAMLATTAMAPETVITNIHDRLDKISLPNETLISTSAEIYHELFADIQEAVTKANATFPRVPQLPGIRTGFLELDDMMGGLQKGHTILVGGRPSMGKSAWLTNVAQNVALGGDNVAIISYEMTKKQMMLRSVSAHTRTPSDKMIRGDMNFQEMENIMVASTELTRLPIHWVYDPGNIDNLLLTMRRLVRMNKCKLIIIDYVNLIPGGVGFNATEKLGYISAVLKGAAANLNVPIVVACQLNRNLESRDDQRPQLSDLKQSGNLEQDADAVIFLHREVYFVERRRPDVSSPDYNKWLSDFNRWNGRAELLLRKNRHGRIGEAEVGFDSSTTRFFDMAA